VTGHEVLTALHQVGVRPGQVVMVHSALSRLGWVIGGAQTVVEALLAAVGPDGTIVMPAHTGISDPSTWSDPPVPESWWPAIREHLPPFDPLLTPLRRMGAVVETFRHLPGVVHSGHPALAVIARGPAASFVAHPHHLSLALDDSSPLGRLYEIDARVVLIGVGHGNNTSLHLAEHRAVGGDGGNGGGGEVPMAAPMLVDGARRWVTYSDLDRDSSDFPALGRAFVAAGGDEESTALGAGRVTSVAVRAIVDFAVDWLRDHRARPDHRPRVRPSARNRHPSSGPTTVPDGTPRLGS
jgi:aminoglycoside 3-N-acetyltransferase